MITKADVVAFQSASPEERRRLAGKYLKENEPLIIKLVKKYTRYAPAGSEWEDLMQAGRIAFLKALPGSDPNRAFSTYFGYWLKNELRRVTEKVGEIFRPHHSVMDYKSVQIENKVQSLHGRAATAEELGVSEERLAMWREQPMRLDLTETAVFADSRDTAEEALEETQEKLEAQYFVSFLPPRDQEMLRRLRKGEKIKDVAKALGMKQQQVRDRLREIADE